MKLYYIYTCSVITCFFKLSNFASGGCLVNKINTVFILCNLDWDGFTQLLLDLNVKEDCLLKDVKKAFKKSCIKISPRQESRTRC